MKADGAIEQTASFDLLQMDRTLQRRVRRRRATHVAGWSALVALGLARRGVLGWALAAGGIYGLVSDALAWREGRPEWRKEASHHEPSWVRRLLAPRRADPVDQRSAQSFPASDPAAPAR